MSDREQLDLPGPKALTSIPSGIHWAATDEPEPDTDYQQEFDELDEMAVNHFLDTLAEVAMAVANRKLAQNHKGDQLTE